MSQTLAFSTSSAVAQITPDATLPNNSSVKLEGSTRIIEGGTQAGSNLFHSFGEFSVPTRSTAYFNHALDIQNIISRVTGGSVSNIDGLIRASGTANLFLINPNGIIFGPNASLNIGGSFVATTANAIGFGNQGFFSATNPNTPALLTVNPNAFLFNQIASGSITSQARLQVPSGKSLLLVGGNVSLNNSGLNAEKIELGGVAGSGTIGLNYDSPDGSNLSLNFSNGVEWADVSIAAGCIPDFDSCVASSSIAINARNIDFSGESPAIGKNVTLNATNAIGVSNFGSIRATNNLNIRTRTLSVSNGFLGGANNTLIQANESVFITNGGLIQNSSGGDINIETKSFTLTNEARSLSLNNTELQTLLRETNGVLPGGVGRGGEIDINVRDTVTLAGGSGILGTVGTGAQGQGGGIKIRAGSLSLTEGARLDTSTAGQGDAGQIFVEVADSVSLSNNAKIRSTVEAGAIGQGNDIEIVARSLSVTNGAQVSASTSGQGNAGNIQINAANGSVRVSDPLSRLSTQTNSNNGQGGAISVNTSTFFIANNADLNATTTAGSPSGRITVKIKANLSSLDAAACHLIPGKLLTVIQFESIG